MSDPTNPWEVFPPCEQCGRDPASDCECPECEICHTVAGHDTNCPKAPTE